MASLGDRDLAAFWHPCSWPDDLRASPPPEVVSARGARLTLAGGRELLDGISSWWCKSLGHGHPGVRARIERQLDRFEHVITANTTSAALVELCERLLDLGGRAHFGKVFLADNGSTGVEIALKMALQAQAQRGQPQRLRFAALANGYHGETAGALSVGDLGLYADPYRAMMFPVVKLAPLPYRSGPDDPRWLDASTEWPAIEAALAAAAPSLAAVIYEPVLQAAGGMRLYSPDLLPRLRRWADAAGVYLIADEIAAGMGRLGVMMASHLAPTPALPDFAVLSKGLTAGFLPLAAVLTTNSVHALFEGPWADRRAFLHSNTYTGNALAVAAALGALDAYADERVLDHVSGAAGPRLGAGMRALAGRLPGVIGARGCGMVAAVDLTTPDGGGGGALDPAARTGYRVAQEAIRRGMLLRPLGDTLYLFPPLNCAGEDLDAMLRILEESIAAVVATRAAGGQTAAVAGK